MDVTVRHTEPEDYEALHRIFSGSKATAGTLQMPLPSGEMWRKRLSEPPEGLFSLVGQHASALFRASLSARRFAPCQHFGFLFLLNG